MTTSRRSPCSFGLFVFAAALNQVAIAVEILESVDEASFGGQKPAAQSPYVFIDYSDNPQSLPSDEQPTIDFGGRRYGDLLSSANAATRDCGPNAHFQYGVCERGCSGSICAPRPGVCACNDGLLRRACDYACVPPSECFVRFNELDERLCHLQKYYYKFMRA